MESLCNLIKNWLWKFEEHYLKTARGDRFLMKLSFLAFLVCAFHKEPIKIPALIYYISKTILNYVNCKTNLLAKIKIQLKIKYNTVGFNLIDIVKTCTNLNKQKNSIKYLMLCEYEYRLTGCSSLLEGG